MANFRYYHVEIKKSQSTREVVVTGEIINDTEKAFSTVGVRIILYVNNVSVANLVFTINGLSARASKAFEKIIEDLDYLQIGKNVNRYEIYTETAF